MEIELLTPPGVCRRDVADRLAQTLGGAVEPFFHVQSEPSKVPGTPVFHNLSHGFAVRDPVHGERVRCVGDLTLQDDLNREAAAKAGWYRIVSDDRRLLGLVERHCSPSAPIATVLAPIAEIFGTELEPGPAGMVRVTDDRGAPIALVAPMPGERERTCEIVTPPLDAEHHAHLEALLEPARALGLSCPAEGAVHLHFDAQPLQSASAVQRLVRWWTTYGPTLRALVGTNPRCRRLGDWPDALYTQIEAPDFAYRPWPLARNALRTTGLSKYCDLNLRNFVHDLPGKHTVEFRIFPPARTAEPILHWAALAEAILRRALDPSPIPRRDPLAPSPLAARTLIESLPLEPNQKQRWHTRSSSVGPP